MDELKLITASNIIKLRTGAGMTQAELGEKLNYSDKTVSKWERAESVPDVYALKRIGQIFDVSVDYLISQHDEWENSKNKKAEEREYSGNVVTMVSIAGIWTLAVLLFVIFWLLGSFKWFIFVAAVPATLITLLVFNSIWHRGQHNCSIVALLVLSLFVLVYLTLLPYNPWQLFLVLIPSELVVFLSFRIRKR